MNEEETKLLNEKIQNYKKVLIKENIKLLELKTEIISYNPKTSKEEFMRFISLLEQTQISCFLFVLPVFLNELYFIKHKYLNKLLSLQKEYQILETKKTKIMDSSISGKENDTNIFGQKALALLYDQLSNATENTGILDETNIGIEDINISHDAIKEKSLKLQYDLKKAKEDRKVDAANLIRAIGVFIVVLLLVLIIRFFKRVLS